MTADHGSTDVKACSHCSRIVRTGECCLDWPEQRPVAPGVAREERAESAERAAAAWVKAAFDMMDEARRLRAELGAARAAIAAVQAFCDNADRANSDEGPSVFVADLVAALPSVAAGVGAEPTQPEPDDVLPARHECPTCGHWMDRHDDQGCTIVAGTADGLGDSPCACRRPAATGPVPGQAEQTEEPSA